MADDLTKIHEELDNISSKLRAHERAAAHLAESYAELEDLHREKRKLYDILRKEESDVNKLEAMSVNALFRLFLKNKEEQLEIEHQEYVVAAMKYNECLDTIDLLEFEIDVLERSMETRAELESRRNALLVKKELTLKETYPEIATMLSNIDYKMTVRRIELKEIDQALNAGERARLKLIEIKKLLDKVEGWGAWGSTQYMSKYSKSPFVDRARKTAVDARMVLRKFEQELKDVYTNLHIKDDFTIQAFDHFLGIFYDNLITDWIVRNNLRHTQNSISGTYAKVDRLMASLKHEKGVLERVLQDFEKQKLNLIVSNT